MVVAQATISATMISGGSVVNSGISTKPTSENNAAGAAADYLGARGAAGLHQGRLVRARQLFP